MNSASGRESMMLSIGQESSVAGPLLAVPVTGGKVSSSSDSQLLVTISGSIAACTYPVEYIRSSKVRHGMRTGGMNAPWELGISVAAPGVLCTLRLLDRLSSLFLLAFRAFCDSEV